MLQIPAVEGDLYRGLKEAGIDVLEMRCPEGALSMIAYAKSERAPEVMRNRLSASCSRVRAKGYPRLRRSSTTTSTQ